MISLKLTYFSCILILVTASFFACKPSPPPVRRVLKIALVDSLPINNEDEERRLSDEYIDLLDVIVSENKNCNHVVILDPSILRLDLEQELLLKTLIEKGGSKDISNPKVISKLIKNNLEEINIPKIFTKPSTGKDVSLVLDNFLTTKAAKDSIIVFSSDGSLDEYSLKNRKLKVFSSVEEIRKYITNILCQDVKANFTLLIDPPSINKPIENVNIDSVGTKRIETKRVEEIKTVRVKHTWNSKKVNLTDNGDLTIIKGSEGCDICTRYYSAVDNLGRTRQVTQTNSTECCPCGKTIEMRGQTYVMECNGNGNNRLALVK